MGKGRKKKPSLRKTVKLAVIQGRLSKIKKDVARRTAKKAASKRPTGVSQSAKSIRDRAGQEAAFGLRRRKKK